MRGLIPLAAALALAPGCSSRSTDFSPDRARAHVERLGGAIGSRPIGSAENAAARSYLVDELRSLGLATRVQSTVGRSPHGISGHVHNVIASLDGERRDAVGLVAHYDSIAGGSGAVDDAFGTAVVVEAANVLARRGGRRWSLLVLLTDGEEEGLLGAEALVTDPEVRARVRVVLNVEAMGGGAPVLLFEASPDNGWLVDAWAGATPRPRGSSFNYEIYRRMPNDTDFSVFRRAGIPGLNFSAVGEAYSYHTTLERPERATADALADAGATIVSVVDALESRDITKRTSDGATYFDVLGITAVSWSSSLDRMLGLAALALGVVAAARVVIGLWRESGLRGLVLTVIWSVVGALVVVAAAIGSLALLRAVREVYHPWYSSPARFVAAIVLSAAAAGWLTARLAAHFRLSWLPPRRAGSVLLPTLLVWLVLAVAVSAVAPRAAFLWVLPLLALAAPTAVAGDRPRAAILAGGAALTVGSLLWLRDTWLFVSFLVPLMGGLPVVTPVWVLPALLLMSAAVVAPPLLVVPVGAGVGRPRFLTRALLVSSAFAMAWAYHAPAYTPDRPLRLSMISVSGEPGGTITIVSANEPVPAEGPGGLTLTPAPTPPARLARYIGGAPFVAIAPPQPARASGRATCQVDGSQVIVGLTGVEARRVRLELPAGLTPTAAEPPGIVRGGVWSAVVAGQAAQWTFHLTFGGDAGRACDGRLYVRRAVEPPAGTPGAGAGPASALWESRLVDVLALR